VNQINHEQTNKAVLQGDYQGNHKSMKSKISFRF